MKKGLILIAGFIFLVVISAGIVESLSVLTHDLNAHAWQTLIGRWQSYERAYYEIEFTSVGIFVEYSHGASRSAGTFRISGNMIEMIYDAPYCPSGKQDSCKTEMEFEFVLDTLILTIQGKKSRFKRVELADDGLIGLAPGDPAADWFDGRLR